MLFLFSYIRINKINTATFLYMQKILLIFFLFSQSFLAFCQTDENSVQKKILADYAQPLIVGHRGGFDSKLPENSIALFDFTYANACSKPIGIEFDIRESASGSLFIMHDSTVDRTTNGTGNITLLKDDYIKMLLLKDRTGKLTLEKIPMLSEVLQHFQDKNIMLMLDVKGKIYPQVIRLVTEMKMESKCILLTFHLNNTKLVKEITDKILISALVVNSFDWESVLELKIPSRQLIAYVSEVTSSDLISEITKSNMLVMTDMSESIKNRSNLYPQEYYRYFPVQMQLGILITDYPVYVNKIFCKH